MANTYELITSQTLATSAASITFSSIPSTYTDIQVLIAARSDAAQNYEDLRLKFNGATTGYSAKGLYSVNSSTVTSWTTTSSYCGACCAANDTANTFGNSQIYIANYASSNYKTYSSESAAENNGTGMNIDMYSGLWSNTAAITSINLFCDSGGNFVQYSTFYLYGIKNS